jgi:hypothetical protein
VAVLNTSPAGTADDTIFSWQSITHFVPFYNAVDGALNPPHFFSWVSDGPQERSKQAPGGEIHSFLRFRSDGIANIASTGGGMDSFVALGATGNLLVAGSAIDNDIAGPAKSGNPGLEENHRIQAGIGIKSHNSPDKAMLTGRWLFAGTVMRVGEGGDGWSQFSTVPPVAPGGNETAEFSLRRAILTIDSSGGVSGNFTKGNLMTGEITSEPLPVGFINLLDPTEECFGVGLPLSDSTCAGGIKVWTFRLYEDKNPENGQYDPGEEGQGRFVLDQGGSVLTLFDIIDLTGTPFNTVDDSRQCDRFTDPLGETAADPVNFKGCGDASSSTHFYTGVKIE